MSPAPSVASVVSEVRRAIRRDNTVAIVAVLAGGAPLLLIAAWLLSGWSLWASPSPLPLLLDAGVLVAAVAFAVWSVRRLRRMTGERAVAAAAEAGAGLPAGSVLSVLELGREVPSGTSEALVRRAESALGRELAGRATVEISGEVGRASRRRQWSALAACGGACVVAVGLALVSPERSRAGWPALVTPLAHLTGPLLPALAVEPGDMEVPRGAEVAVRVRAAGRFAVTVHHRADGDVPRSETVAVLGDSAVIRFVVDARTVYWAEAPDGATSERFTVLPLDPLLVSELALEVRFPPWTGRPAERYETDMPAIEVPEGTTLAVAGRATLPLTAAALTAAGERIELQIRDDRFSASWTPAASQTYTWQLHSAAAGGVPVPPPPIDVTVVPDGGPQVEMTFPAVDTVLDASRVQPLAADAVDDFGIATATLVSWRVSGGERGAAAETPIPIDSAQSRVFIRGVLDARSLDLLPGDTIRYFVRVRDNGPRAQTASTASFAFYMPGRPELRDRAERQVDDAVEEAAALARSARELQDATRDLQRRTQASRARTGSEPAGARQGQRGGQGSLGFRESEQARQVLEEQEKLAARLDEMRQRLEAMERALEDAGLRDSELQRELEELRELYDRMLTPELRQQMDRLREALENLDPEQLQTALEELAARQEEIREQLQRSLEQLRQAATEEQLGALAQDARELATQQAALAEAMKNGRSGPDAARQQRELEARARELQQSVAQLDAELQRRDERAAEASVDAGAAIERSREQMRDAAAGAESGLREAAGRGEQAARELEQAARDLDTAREAVAQSAQRQLDEAMQQALRDAESIAGRQEELRRQMEQAQQSGEQGQRGQGQQGRQAGDLAQQMGDRQTELQQELNRLNQDLARTADQSGQVSREVGAEMGRANASMERTAQAMQEAGQQAGRSLPTREAAQTVEALQRLAQAIERNLQQIQQADPASAAEQTRQQLGEIAQQQGQLNGRTNALLPMGLSPQSLMQQAERLAEDQRRIAQRIEELDRRGAGKEEILGRLEEMADEAERLAQALAGGRPPAEVVARQERLFHRLLDAGRTLERDELSEERVGERPGDWTPIAPLPLDPALLQPGERYRLPSAEQLRALPPAYRRMVLEYFGRINRSAGRGE